MDNRKQRNNEFVSSGQVGELEVTKRSGGDREVNRKGKKVGFDGRDRKATNHANESWQNSALDGELSRLPIKKEIPAHDGKQEHAIPKSGRRPMNEGPAQGGKKGVPLPSIAEYQDGIQQGSDLVGHPFPKPGKLRKGLSKRNASPIRSAARIPGMAEPVNKSSEMSEGMRSEIKHFADDPEEN